MINNRRKKLKINKKKVDNYCRAGELRRMLENIDDDTVIILASDPEGNNYSPLDKNDFFFGKYEPFSESHIWSGEIDHVRSTPNMTNDNQDDIIEYSKDCIVFSPMS